MSPALDHRHFHQSIVYDIFFVVVISARPSFAIASRSGNRSNGDNTFCAEWKHFGLQIDHGARTPNCYRVTRLDVAHVSSHVTGWKDI